jgi:hypothetical protein
MKRGGLIKFESCIPCEHQDISFMGASEGCATESEWAENNDCSVLCPDYKARPIEVCKKHHREFVGKCENCFGDYWEKVGRESNKQWQMGALLKDKLHMKLKYGKFDRFDSWVLNIKPEFHTTWQADIDGKKRYRGIEITAFKRCVEIGIYL